MDDDELLKELQIVVERLNECVDVLVRSANDLGCTPYEIRSVDGSYLLHSLLVSKANAMAAIVQLTASKTIK